MHVGLPFFGAFYAERSDHDCGIPIDLHVALLGDGLGRLIVRRLNTGQKFALGGNAAVNIDGYKGVGKDHVQSLRVFGLQGVIPRVFKRKNAASFIVNAFLLRHRQGNAQQQNPNGQKSPSHGFTLRTETRNGFANMHLA